MLKILQARLHQYVNLELPDVQAGFKKRQRNQRSNCQHHLDHRKSKRFSEKHLFLLYWLRQTLLDPSKLWKILKETNIPDHLTCLLRNLYAGQEATVRTGHGTRLLPNRKRSTSRLYIVTLFHYSQMGQPPWERAEIISTLRNNMTQSGLNAWI